MIYGNNDYESIRPMRADDIGDVLRLMEPLVQEGILITRSEDELTARHGDFVVYSIDDVVHACGALHDYGEGQGEIAAIATNPVYGHLSMGRKIVSYLIEKAARIGNPGLRSTTRTTDCRAVGFRRMIRACRPERCLQPRAQANFRPRAKDRKPIKS